jgi:anion-transporting  ArsA/GET3 family ATPase
MAARGAKVAVVTIDPAKRLATALGLEELENEPRLVEPELLRPGLELRGELWAMMLDPKQTFDELIERLAPDRRSADEILANRVYRELSTAVAGSQEFTAVSKLYELNNEYDFDLLVLDTPPSRNALDFLDAPGRLTSFLEGRTLKMFVRPTGLGMKILGRGSGALAAGLQRVTGVDLLADLSTFFRLLGGMTDDFRVRAAAVEKMLMASTTAFVLVTSAQREPIDEAIWFRRTLRETGLPFSGTIVNRVHHDILGSGERSVPLRAEVIAALDNGLGGDLAERVAENFYDYHVLARRDELNISRLAAGGDGRPLVLVPHFDDDVHDVEGLIRVHRYLFASDAERDRMIAEVVA